MDGYTRIPVYFKANTNNSSDTVLDLFRHAIHEYGLPSRVRSDKGGEKNVNIWKGGYVRQNPHCWKQIAYAVVHSWPVEIEGERVDCS